MITSSKTADYQRRIYSHWAPVYDRFYARILEPAHRILAQRASAHGGDVLEVGVGTGLGLAYYDPSCKLTGIDISEEMLARAQQKLARLQLRNVNLRVMDAHKLEFSDAAFDVVTLPFVLTLVAEPEAVLSECARVTKPGGAIIVASRISRGGILQSKLERAVSPVARRIGLSSSFHLSTIERWSKEHGGVSLEAVEGLRPMAFLKLVTIHRKPR